MANPQLEDGYIAIAYDLWVAKYQYNFSSLEAKVLEVIMALTYGAGKTKAEIDVDDIRYQLGGTPPLRAPRIEAIVEKLLQDNVIFRQSINQHRYLLGVQKDYDKWGAQTERMSKNYTQVANSINTNNTTCVSKIDTVQELLSYGQSLLRGKYSIQQEAIERRNARGMYSLATRQLRSPAEAKLAVKDYLDELTADDWVKAHVKMLFTFALSRFEQWLRVIPEKPYTIRRDEEALGRPYRWNHKLKRWEPR